MGKKIVILGAGESGLGAAVLAKKLGHEIFVSDFGDIKENYIQELNDLAIEWEQNGHTETKILNADLIIKSPGIPEKAPIIKLLKSRNKEVIGEIEFAARHTNAKIIAITGSNGKTTTTSLTYSLYKEGGKNVGVAGNIGESFARQVATKNFEYYILEVSSFQLDDTIQFKPDVSVILNITPDHLDRYNYNFNEYVASKFKITANQTANNVFIYCQDDTAINNYLSTHKIKAEMIPFSLQQEVEHGAFLKDEKLTIKLKKKLSPCQYTI